MQLRRLYKINIIFTLVYLKKDEYETKIKSVDDNLQEYHVVTSFIDNI